MIQELNLELIDKNQSVGKRGKDSNPERRG